MFKVLSAHIYLYTQPTVFFNSFFLLLLKSQRLNLKCGSQKGTRHFTFFPLRPAHGFIKRFKLITPDSTPRAHGRQVIYDSVFFISLLIVQFQFVCNTLTCVYYFSHELDKIITFDSFIVTNNNSEATHEASVVKHFKLFRSRRHMQGLYRQGKNAEHVFALFSQNMYSKCYKLKNACNFHLFIILFFY